MELKPPTKSQAKKLTILAALLLGALLLPPLAFPEEYSGRVVGITDGDTLTLLTDGNRQVKIRLAEIDTPESGQPYGKRAKQELSELSFNKTARVQVQDIDRYGRTVGRVFVDGVDVNAEMVKRGAAWAYRKYARDGALFKLEDEARREKRGLWSLPESERVPPWEWRHKRRNAAF
jgi:endonuclease YncB( thermonuclease family)